MSDSGSQPQAHPNVNAIPEQSESAEKDPKSLVDMLLGPQVPPPPEDRKHTTHRPDQTPIWKIVLEVGAVFVGACAVAIYGGQLWVMWGQLGQMQSANRLTNSTLCEIQRQTTLMRQQLEGTMEAVIPRTQPWPNVLPDDIEYIRRNGIVLEFKNSGKIPARDFIVDACLSIRRWPSYALIGKTQCEHDSRPELRPYDLNLSSAPGSFIEEVPLRFDAHSLTQSDLDKIRAFNEGIEVQCTFQYDNGFNRVVKNSLTFFYVTLPPHIDGIIHPIDIGGGKGWVLMDDEGKRRITEALKWKK